MCVAQLEGHENEVKSCAFDSTGLCCEGESGHRFCLEILSVLARNSSLQFPHLTQNKGDTSPPAAETRPYGSGKSKKMMNLNVFQFSMVTLLMSNLLLGNQIR